MDWNKIHIGQYPADGCTIFMETLDPLNNVFIYMEEKRIFENAAIGYWSKLGARLPFTNV